MQRRDFLASAAAAGLAVSAGAPTARAASAQRQFHLKYAPHFGMLDNLAGRDEVAQLEFAADQGFTAWEDNGMKGRPVEQQEKLAKAMDRLGMTMGVFVAYGIGSFGKKSFTSDDAGMKEEVLKEITESVEVAKRVNAKWMTVVPGAFDNHLEEGYQTANCIELLKRCSEILEPHGMVMVLEPLNWWANHPGLFLRETPQAFNICRAVGSPSCKILFDIYHQQIQEGNLIPNIDRAWSEIGYFQCGDNPGRKEPGTGEINYNNVFKHLYEKGFEGVMGMEHGKSIGGAEGDQALIDAYVRADDF
ncbi:Hydroxypyruvate isomerase [Posidoniimonas polymericola]|uniref:Hydroxypyruvate isomerase n=1 Tax=Posidoniimonas polymericola TaxID=2528002 RepID=A0A5C5YTY0_9BACT|nr:TIM barrel protein [Posidoniimonas polymericola]TWT78260.1 Hydroxypyruvate isomerase [Posidoniimonas polymericola]